MIKGYACGMAAAVRFGSAVKYQLRKRSADLPLLCLALIALCAGAPARAQGLPDSAIATTGAEVYWSNEQGPPYFRSAQAACNYFVEAPPAV